MGNDVAGAWRRNVLIAADRIALGESLAAIHMIESYGGNDIAVLARNSHGDFGRHVGKTGDIKNRLVYRQ